MEMGIKLYGFGLKGYCSDTFNIVDGLIVILSLVEMTLQIQISDTLENRFSHSQPTPVSN
jgi:hypothetical protein